MNRIVFLVVVALITFVLVLFVQRPDILNDIWLWLVGLAGTIVGGFRAVVDFFKDRFSSDDPASKSNQQGNTVPQASTANNSNTSSSPVGVVQMPVEDSFTGTSITVLRFSDDGETSVGLLFINGKYFCYTLEDTFREVKVPGKTRIPSGTFDIDFRRADTELTLKYRDRYPDWFNYHIEIKDIPNFTSVYIHSGGDHTHTEGCLLVSDSLSMTDEKTFFTNSRDTFKRLYQFISGELQKGVQVRMIIKDENWFENVKAS
ncbi:MAG: DUF5675 family protein [Bacteroidota bacterium]